VQNLCSVGEEEILEITAAPQQDASHNIPDPVIVDQPINGAPISDNANIKSIGEKVTDTFLDKAYKKKVSDEIRQRNREEKLLHKSATQDLSSVTKDEKFQSYKKREAENIVQDAFDFTAASAPEKII
jgi:hypothetical protein